MINFKSIPPLLILSAVLMITGVILFFLRLFFPDLRAFINSDMASGVVFAGFILFYVSEKILKSKNQKQDKSQ